MNDKVPFHARCRRFGFCALALTVVLLTLASCGKPSDDSGTQASTPTPPQEKELAITFAYGSEKEDWVKEVTADFNNSNARLADGTRIVVNAIPMGSGECIESVLSGTLKADLVSPASMAFLKIGNAESRAKTGKDLAGSPENLVMSPVVIAMWKPMAEAIGWGKKDIGWSDILALAKTPDTWATMGYPQWGAFKFGHTHPESSNSGLAALIAEVYSGANKVAGLTVEDVNKPEVAAFLAGIEQSVVHYGNSTGFFGKKMFANGPAYLSAAVLYENMVIESYDPKYNLPFPIVAIYPKEGTFWSDHPAAIVDRDWVTPDHREAAQKYLDFLLAAPQQQKAIPHGFRPVALDIPLTAPLDTAHGIDPKQPKTTLEVPSVPVITSILDLWRTNKKHANITLVLDVSGSMNEEQRLVNAKKGALQFLSSLGNADRLAFLPFNNTLMWASKGVTLDTGRGETEARINSLYAGGGTALYDAIRAAYEKQLKESDAQSGRISAVVVLTDGQDTDSATSLEQLLAEIRGSDEKNTVRIFTIGYGSDANEAVLKQIADATQAKYYKGTPDNIRAIFRDIATFF